MMEQELWKEISEVFSIMETHVEQLRVIEDLDSEEVTGNPENNILLVRDTIRKQIDTLRISFAGDLTEQESYYTLFAIIVYIDEIIQTKVLDKTYLSWPLLQMEFYEVDDGGNLFYDTLDHIITKPQIPLFVFEVYYFCLKHGFTGRYLKDPVKIAEYKKTLENKILVNDIESEIIPPHRSEIISYLFSPLWYYVTAFSFLLFIYLGFASLG